MQSVYHKAEQCAGNEWLKLVHAQCFVVHNIFSEGTKTVCDAAERKLHKAWIEVCEQVPIDSVL